MVDVDGLLKVTWLEVRIKEADTAISPWRLLGAFRSLCSCIPRRQRYSESALESPLRTARPLNIVQMRAWKHRGIFLKLTPTTKYVGRLELR